MGARARVLIAPATASAAAAPWAAAAIAAVVAAAWGATAVRMAAMVAGPGLMVQGGPPVMHAMPMMH